MHAINIGTDAASLQARFFYLRHPHPRRVVFKVVMEKITLTDEQRETIVQINVRITAMLNVNGAIHYFKLAL